MSLPKYLRPREASAYLLEVFGIHRTPNTLCKDRCIGGGPEFVRFGRVVLYPVESLHAWVEGPHVTTQLLPWKISEPRTLTSDRAGKNCRAPLVAASTPPAAEA